MEKCTCDNKCNTKEPICCICGLIRETHNVIHNEIKGIANLGKRMCRGILYRRCF